MATLSSGRGIIPLKSSKSVTIDLSDEEQDFAVPRKDPAKVIGALNGNHDGDRNGLREEREDSINRFNDDDDDDDGSDGTFTSDLIAAGQDPDFEFDDSEMCTEEESKAYRRRLREIGLDDFVFETVSSGKITAKKLCSAFGLRLPKSWKGEPDDAYYRMLAKALIRELQSRQKLPQYNTMDDAVALLQKSKAIMVITGAGISTNLGIPDFRSNTTGFYAQMRAAGFQSPEEVFNIEVFDEDPSIFYTYAVDTFPKGGVCSSTHTFIRLLQDRNKLLTNFTQNIDNVEEVAGIARERLIQCHGSWASATCRKCRHTVRIEEVAATIRAKEIPRCAQCVKEIEIQMRGPRPKLKRKRTSNSIFKPNKSRKRSDDDDDDDDGAYDIPEPGVMKPDITFFGEALPEAFFDRIRNHDCDLVDLVIVIGTSMQVAPVSEIPRAVQADVPQIYISRDPCSHINFDIALLGDCDVITGELARRAGWPLNHAMLPKDRQVLVKPHEEGLEATWRVTPVP